MEKLSFFTYVISGIFFLAAYGAYGNQEYQSMVVYLIIGLAFILVKFFKHKKNTNP